MTEQRLYFNGINALTGQYLAPPLSLPEAAALVRGAPPDPQQVGWFRNLLNRFQGRFFGLPIDLDPKDVTSAGWAVVFAADTPPLVRSALEPLIAHRRQQVPPDRCKVLEYQPGESREDWLKRYGARGADVDPTRVPYYLMLVGGPASIPFEFQYLLDLDYAAGRLAFDRPEQYRQYADSVVAYETAATVPNSREVVFFGTHHDNDPATSLSADYLIRPLYEGLPAADGNAAQPAIAERLRFRARCFRADDATKANLAGVLHTRAPQAPPALVFTASHGMGGWPRGDARQRPAQGALLCQDWSGFGTMLPEHYFAAADVADDARVHGLVAFHFACYGAGTPAFDNFLYDRSRGPVPIADGPFVAALPQRLLSHPQGGALAVIGHIERAWGYSIQPPGVGPQLTPFRNLIGRILGGEPVGHSTQDFSQRYATFSTELLDQLDTTRPGVRPTDADLVWNWIERNDAQNYVVLGDPGVRLRTELLK